MKSFNELLRLYRSDTATKEEILELFDLLQTGEYDDIVDVQTMEIIETEKGSASEEEKIFGEQMFDRIRAGHIRPVKIIPIRAPRSVWWKAVAAIILAALIITIWTMRNNHLFSGGIPSEQQATNSSVYFGKQLISLPDGTRVILNETSVLRHDHTFGLTSREVFFSGEGYFDVKHNADIPFIVRTGNVSTKVLGTAFNINAYPEEQQVIVTVVRGLVEVGNGQRIYGKVSPDQQMEINRRTHDFARKNVASGEALKWKDNFLILADVSMEEAGEMIGKKFSVQIKFENDALKKCRFDGTFLRDESLHDVLAMMSTVVNMSYTLEKGGIVIFRGKGCY